MRDKKHDNNQFLTRKYAMRIEISARKMFIFCTNASNPKICVCNLERILWPGMFGLKRTHEVRAQTPYDVDGMAQG